MSLLSGKHIYVVEDDVTNLAITCSILRRNGATTAFDRWGLETIDRMKKEDKIDLIILDLMFPNGVSGYDVFDQIQATPSLADIPVVIVSASDAGAEMNRARDKGVMGFVSKPIHHLTFPKIISTVLEGTPIWGDVM